MTKDDFTKRADALQHRGLNWPLCSALRYSEDLSLLAQVEALSDDDLRKLTRLPPKEHPLPRYQADKILAQRWLAQANDIVERRGMPAFALGGSWCVTLADEELSPGEGAHIVADFVDEQVAKSIVASHNDGLS